MEWSRAGILEAVESDDVNLGQVERIASVAAGGALIAYGLTRGSWRGLALALLGGGLAYRGATGHCDIYAALGLGTEEKPPQTAIPARHGVRVEKSVIVGRPAKELFAFWRGLEGLPRVMSHLQSVRVIDDRRSHWVARGPLGATLEWDAEIINEVENELIGWRSLEGAGVDTAGSVHFDALGSGRETRVTVILKYDPPAGKIGAGVARLLGEDPETQVEEDLERFRMLMETGEVVAPGSVRS